MAVVFMVHTDYVLEVYYTIIQEDSAHRPKIHLVLTTLSCLALFSQESAEQHSQGKQSIYCGYEAQHQMYLSLKGPAAIS